MEQESEIRDIPPREPLALNERQVKYVIAGALAALCVLLITLGVAVFAVRSAKKANQKVDTLSQELEAASEGMRVLQEKYDTLNDPMLRWSRSSTR